MAAAASLADVLRENIRRKRIVNRATGQDMGEITVSIGVGQYVAGEPCADLFVRAVGLNALYLGFGIAVFLGVFRAARRRGLLINVGE